MTTAVEEVIKVTLSRLATATQRYALHALNLLLSCIYSGLFYLEHFACVFMETLIFYHLVL